MLQRVVRQRRRLALVALLGLIEGLVEVLGSLPGAGWHSPALFALVNLALAGLLVCAVPTHRALAEKIAFGGLVGSVAALGFEGAVATVIDIGLAALVPLAWWALEGLVARALAHPVPIAYSSARIVRLAPETALARLLPEPGERHWNPLVARIAEGTGGTRVLHYHADGPLADLVGRIEPEARRPGLLRYRSQLTPRVMERSEPQGPMPAVTEVRAEPDPLGCRLEMTERQSAMPLYFATLGWLDDLVGDSLDQFAAVMEGRPDHSVKAADAG